MVEAAGEESCLIVQVPVGAVVKQLREGVRKSRSQEERGREGGGRAAPEKQSERESSWKTQRLMNIEKRGWRVGISAGCTEKLLTSLREVYFNSFFSPFLLLLGSFKSVDFLITCRMF